MIWSLVILKHPRYYMYLKLNLLTLFSLLFRRKGLVIGYYSDFLPSTQAFSYSDEEFSKI